MIDGFSRKIREINIHSAKQLLALTMEDNRIEIWSPGKKTAMKDAVSGMFAIASPKPVIIDTIQFNEQVLNLPREINVQNFALNKTRFPLNITGMEITGNNSHSFEIVSGSYPLKMEPESLLDREFRFTPSKTETIQAIVKTYTLTDTFSTVIMGIGVQQKYKPLLRNLDFGQVNVGSQKDTLAAVLINTNTDTLVLRTIENSGPDQLQFKVMAAQVYKIAPQDTLKVQIRFMPSTRGKTTTLLALAPSMDESKLIVRGEGIAAREVIVTGITRNSADSLPIQSIVKKHDLGSDRLMEESHTSADGRFTFRLAADRNFGITADKPNFLSTSFNIDLTERIPGDTIKQDLYLTEIIPGAIIRFNCIFFESDKATLLPVSEPDLKRLLDVVLKNPDRYFEIHGHTDSQGGETYNLNLSKSRATSIMNYLLKNGVPRDKLSVKFYGESAPVSTNDTEEGRALNRRVELKVIR
jgi:outer membrane protein OmpA-like peptidoglycan-associated protein